MADDKPRWVVTRETVKEVFEIGQPLHFVTAEMLSVRGRPVEIDPGTADFADAILICSDPAHSLPGSILAACDACAAPIVYRPHAPAIKRICLHCAKRRGAFDT